MPAIQIKRSEDRGHADHGWLDTWHTFSFADWYDPDAMGFSVLRVINQDRVKPGRGFGTHGHQDMEIVTYVLEGVLEHEDSMGNGSRLHPGEVQLMSAGTGVTHSEFNGSKTEGAHFLQMWVLPARTGTPPRYEQKDFPASERLDRLRLVVSPDGKDGSLTIGQDASMFVATLEPGSRVTHEIPEGRVAWLHVARGRVMLDNEVLAHGDGAAIRDLGQITLQGLDPAELVLWELPDRDTPGAP